MATKISAQFPALTVPLVDQNGCMTLQWYNSLFTGLWQRTGGPTGVDSSQAATTANNAFSLATTAEETAQLGIAEIGSLSTTVATIGSEATAAYSLANAANTTAQSACIKNSNLSDVTSASTSRLNLGVSTIPVCFQFDSLPSGFTRYYPIARAMIVPAGLSGTQTWCGTYATADSSFTVQWISGGVTTNIGTIDLIHGGNFNVLSSIGVISLNVGDVLALVCPSPADSTLANVGITVLLTLS